MNLKTTKLNFYYKITAGVILLLYIISFYFFNRLEMNFGLVLSACCFFAYISYHSFSNTINKKLKIAVDSILIIYSIFVFLTLIYILTITIVNYPNTKPFKEKLIFKNSNKIEKENFYILNNKLDDFFNNYDKKIQANIEFVNKFKVTDEIKNILKNSYNDRMDIINFISSKKISVPEEELKMDGKIPNYTVLPNIIKLSLTEIQQNNNNIKKYLGLFQYLNNSLDDNYILINYVSILKQIELLIDFYFNTKIKINNSDKKKLTSVIFSITNKLDNNGYNVFTNEYIVIKNIFSTYVYEDSNRSKNNNPDKKNKNLFRHGWPMIDYYKTLNIVHQIFYKLNLMFTKPYYKLSKDLADYNNYIEDHCQFSYFKNPVGSTLIAMSIPKLDKMIVEKEQTKSNLTKMIISLNFNYGKFNQDLPINNMTGKPFKLLNNIKGKYFYKNLNDTSNIYWINKKND